MHYLGVPLFLGVDNHQSAVLVCIKTSQGRRKDLNIVTSASEGVVQGVVVAEEMVPVPIENVVLDVQVVSRNVP